MLTLTPTAFASTTGDSPLHGHFLGERADLHRDLDVRRLSLAHDDVFADDGLKALQRGLDRVGADGKAGHLIDAAGVGDAGQARAAAPGS